MIEKALQLADFKLFTKKSNFLSNFSSNFLSNFLSNLIDEKCFLIDKKYFLNQKSLTAADDL